VTRNLLLTSFLLLASLMTWPFMSVGSQAQPGAEADTDLSRGVAISGRSLRAILAALPELEKRNLKVEDYIVEVSQVHDRIFVYFANPKDVAPGRMHTGCAGPRRCFGVQLAAEDLRIIRAMLSPGQHLSP
jgi:hypothetical protein